MALTNPIPPLSLFRYMSPECARGEPYNAKSDVYSYSLIVHELYSLQKPYDDVPPEFHDELIFYQGARPYLSKTWPKPLRQLLQKSWHSSVSERLTMPEVRAQLASMQPLLIANKQRKYSKFSWLKSDNQYREVQLPIENTDNVSHSSRGDGSKVGTNGERSIWGSSQTTICSMAESAAN